MSDDPTEAMRWEALEAAGICQLCETAPAAPPDCFCAPCRQWVTDSSSEVTDPVERVLNEHWTMTPLCDADHQFCRCGWSIDGGPGYHRRHVAEHIYAALGVDGPAPWVDGPAVTHPEPRMP